MRNAPGLRQFDPQIVEALAEALEGQRLLPAQDVA
jgi:hypothetical protein